MHAWTIRAAPRFPSTGPRPVWPAPQRAAAEVVGPPSIAAPVRLAESGHDDEARPRRVPRRAVEADDDGGRAAHPARPAAGGGGRPPGRRRGPPPRPAG